VDQAVATFVALDAVTALGLAVVAAYFLRIWRATRADTHLLFGLGLLVTAASFLTVAASHYDLGRMPDLWDHARFVGQLGGPIIVLSAYVVRRRGVAARLLVALAWIAVALLVFYAIVIFAIPPVLAMADVEQSLLVMHAMDVVIWSACAWLAFQGSRRRAPAGRFLVPSAFACFAMSKYSWLLADVARDDALLYFIYPWRVLAVVLLLLAIRPARGALAERVETGAPTLLVP
jgi:hypothetical protein